MTHQHCIAERRVAGNTLGATETGVWNVRHRGRQTPRADGRAVAGDPAAAVPAFIDADELGEWPADGYAEKLYPSVSADPPLASGVVSERNTLLGESSQL